jgi:integrin alpha FG-GAP repeat containing protein 1
MEADNPLRIPHSHAFVDLDGDLSTDLLLTGKHSFELWRLNGTNGLQLTQTIPLPVKGAAVIGQSIFVDVNFDGKLDHLVPVCSDYKCYNSSFYIFSDNQWQPVLCDLKDPSGKVWTFQPPDASQFYQEALTARSGDFNLDGYPDLLVTLTYNSQVRAVLLENAGSEGTGVRHFVPKWDLLAEWNTTSVMATMYDIQEKGVLDVLLVHRPSDGQLQMAAYKNTLDYDANFIKVVVLTGEFPTAPTFPARPSAIERLSPTVNCSWRAALSYPRAPTVHSSFRTRSSVWLDLPIFWKLCVSV